MVKKTEKRHKRPTKKNSEDIFEFHTNPISKEKGLKQCSVVACILKSLVDDLKKDGDFDMYNVAVAFMMTSMKLAYDKEIIPSKGIADLMVIHFRDMIVHFDYDDDDDDEFGDYDKPLKYDA